MIMIMNHLEAQRFVEAWQQAWNAHDVDAVFSSPVAAPGQRGPDLRRAADRTRARTDFSKPAVRYRGMIGV